MVGNSKGDAPLAGWGTLGTWAEGYLLDVTEARLVAVHIAIVLLLLVGHHVRVNEDLDTAC